MLEVKFIPLVQPMDRWFLGSWLSILAKAFLSQWRASLVAMLVHFRLFALHANRRLHEVGDKLQGEGPVSLVLQVTVDSSRRDAT
jgi:hypothetical protein